MSETSTSETRITRRHLLLGGATVVAGGVAWRNGRKLAENGLRSDIFIARSRCYEMSLEPLIADGLSHLGWTKKGVRGKSVMLKPNLVEPSRSAPQINTHPAVVRAAAEVFRSWGAREVFVAEGQGHCRDSQFVLDESGLGPMLDHEKLEFVDLNHDEVFDVANRFRASTLGMLHLPASLRRADIVVSLPKVKTHHWAGVTLAMKNFFGVMPGVAYGWPKNVLHHAGIAGSILDINAAVRPHLAIVDGIVGMEGDGPLMGTPVPLGVLVMGTNLPAVDATATRLMGIDPTRIPYLVGASGRLGPILENHITQRGEPIAAVARRFEILDHPRMAYLRPENPSGSVSP